MSKIDLILFGAGAALVLSVVVYLAGRKAAAAAGQVAAAVNPLNYNNIFSSSVNDVGAAVSGDSDFSLGNWFYDVTHTELDVRGPVVPAAAGSAASAPAEYLEDLPGAADFEPDEPFNYGN